MRTLVYGTSLCKYFVAVFYDDMATLKYCCTLPYTHLLLIHQLINQRRLMLAAEKGALPMKEFGFALHKNVFEIWVEFLSSLRLWS